MPRQQTLYNTYENDFKTNEISNMFFTPVYVDLKLIWAMKNILITTIFFTQLTALKFERFSYSSVPLNSFYKL